MIRSRFIKCRWTKRNPTQWAWWKRCRPFIFNILNCPLWTAWLLLLRITYNLLLPRKRLEVNRVCTSGTTQSHYNFENILYVYYVGSIRFPSITGGEPSTLGTDATQSENIFHIPTRPTSLSTNPPRDVETPPKRTYPDVFPEPGPLIPARSVSRTACDAWSH